MAQICDCSKVRKALLEYVAHRRAVQNTLTMLMDVANILSFSGNQVADTTGGAEPSVTPATPFRIDPTWANRVN